LTLALLLLLARPATAATQQWPFAFDAGLAPDASTVEIDLALGAASLPPLPVSELQTLTTNAGTMTLWFWPENAALLQSALSSGPGRMAWPTTPVLCANTAAFSLPTLLPADAGPTCSAAAAQIQSDLSEANLAACPLVEQPELYVYGYSPTDVSTAVNSLEGMIGLAGESFTHGQLPPENLLPASFVPELRQVIDKLRASTLTQSLQTSQSAFQDASSTLSANAGCFDPTAASALATAISGLSADLTAANTYLNDLVSSGEAASAQENVCLAARSQARATLPFPSLTQADRQFLAFWLGGVYWRMRGGALIPLGSTQEARLYYLDDAFSQIGTLVGGTDGAATGFPFYTEVIVDGWSQWMDMDVGDGGTRYDNLIGMTERGQREAQAGINALSGYDAGALMTGGLQMGPGYYFGWWSLPGFTWDDPMPSPYSAFIDGPTAIGEFNMGAALAAGLARTLLAGKPTGQPPTVVLCAQQACGDDGCGGSCGTCSPGTTCTDAGQCEPQVGPADGGSGPFDAGSPDAGGADGGTISQPDSGAGPSPDAGIEPFDAGGGSTLDAGEEDGGGDGGLPEEHDAGPLESTDAGPPAPDAGLPPSLDAGLDGGIPDGGPAKAGDAGAMLSGVDAGSALVRDAGITPLTDGGPGTRSEASTAGCGCGSSGSNGLELFVVWGALLSARRRRWSS
jgi:hypothetical protein